MPRRFSKLSPLPIDQQTDRGLRPIVYLDVDDVLVSWRNPNEAAPAHGAAVFVRWLLAHCEVRWLTMWAPSGTMTPERLIRLEGLLELDFGELEPIHNPRRFEVRLTSYSKYPGINRAEIVRGRRVVWVDDKLQEFDAYVFEQRGMGQIFLRCNTTQEPDALREAAAEIARRFDLPAAEIPPLDPATVPPLIRHPLWR